MTKTLNRSKILWLITKTIFFTIVQSNLLGGVYFDKMTVNNVIGELTILLICCTTTPFTISFVPQIYVIKFHRVECNFYFYEYWCVI